MDIQQAMTGRVMKRFGKKRGMARAESHTGLEHSRTTARSRCSENQ
jgi:hypothetical protein